ncbi:hypothetical protein AMJ49_05890 [Parcubacteria bacterium DG_74_2]|nr:MAG: hypothetical protein AMJ49_05890 [Parcubacteria bacterium DG_74_2]
MENQKVALKQKFTPLETYIISNGKIKEYDKVYLISLFFGLRKNFILKFFRPRFLKGFSFWK